MSEPEKKAEVVASLVFTIMTDGTVVASPLTCDAQYVPTLVDCMLGQARQFNAAYANKINELLRAAADNTAKEEARLPDSIPHPLQDLEEILRPDFSKAEMD